MKLQFSLNAYDPAAKKRTFKIVLIEGKIKNVFFRQAYTANELKSEFPDAVITVVGLKNDETKKELHLEKLVFGHHY
jgi:hypothetical protein